MNDECKIRSYNPFGRIHVEFTKTFFFFSFVFLSTKKTCNIFKLTVFCFYLFSFSCTFEIMIVSYISTKCSMTFTDFTLIVIF